MCFVWGYVYNICEGGGNIDTYMRNALLSSGLWIDGANAW